MALFSTLIKLSFLSTLSFAQNYIEVANYQAPNDYYLTFVLKNIDSSPCGETISAVQIYENSVWRSNSQYYYEDNIGDRYAWGDNGVLFTQMLPISVKIVMNTGREITLWGIITDLTATSVFTTTELICDGTLPPTPQTVAPTTRSPTPPTTAYPTAATICIDDDALDWRSYDHEIKLNGNRFNLKGLSWFGFETNNDYVYGTDIHDVDWYLDWMVDNGFNAIRMPFSKTLIDSTKKNDYLDVVQKAGAKGLLVMPDLHSIAKNDYTAGLPPKSQIIDAWSTMTTLLKDEWNIIAADLFNEPHDVSNSGWGAYISDMEDVADSIWATGVNWLVAIEGTNWQCNIINCAWGENLQGVRDQSVTFTSTSGGANRFLWSPHVYGADVTGNGYSEAGWQAHWGYLHDGTVLSNGIVNVAAQAIGEFGTNYRDTNMINWLDDLITYLIKIDQRNTFFWCLNPNSGDTGGLLQSDWTTPEASKLTALDRLQPDPSKITYNSATNTVCITGLGDGLTSTPTADTSDPSQAPSKAPTAKPSQNPSMVGDTAYPSSDPTTEPSKAPTTKQPTIDKDEDNTDAPTRTSDGNTPTPTAVTKAPTIDEDKENTDAPTRAGDQNTPTSSPEATKGSGDGVDRINGMIGLFIMICSVVNML